MGMAAGQSITGTASALQILRAKDGIPDWEVLDQTVKQWTPHTFVIGMPYNMDGSQNEMTIKADKFLKSLEDRYQIPCITMDERLSTREAKEIAKANADAAGKKFDDRTPVDSLAAQLILESFFNSK